METEDYNYVICDLQRAISQIAGTIRIMAKERDRKAGTVAMAKIRSKNNESAVHPV